MTLSQLRAFLAALELGSFTAAAAHLDTTQASISELIARLEREIGMKLFTRGGRRLVPTAAAVELREHATLSVTAIDNGLEALGAMVSLQGGTCTFGVLRNAAYYDLSDLVQRFHRQYPNVKVRLIGLNSALVADSVADGELEAGLVVLPIEESKLAVRPLFRDEVLYASAKRSTTKGGVTIEEISAAQLVLYDAFAGWRDPTRKQLLERARLKGLPIEPLIEVEHVETALNLVATGAVDTIVSSTIAHGPSFPPGINTYALAEPLYDTLALVHRRGIFLSPATQRIAQLAESTLLAKVAAQTPGRKCGLEIVPPAGPRPVQD